MPEQIVTFYNKEYLHQFDEDERIGYSCQGQIKQALGVVNGKRILDVGCGTGSITEFLVQQNEMYGLDCGESAVSKAIERGIKASVANIESRFPFPDKKFDIVICRETFEHLLTPLNTLHEIHRVLKDDGILYATVPNHFSIEKRIRLLSGKGISASCNYFPNHHEWDYPHIRFFTHTGVIKFLHEGSFEIQKDVSLFYQPLRWVPWEIWNRLKRYWPDLICYGFQFICKKEKRK